MDHIHGPCYLLKKYGGKYKETRTCVDDEGVRNTGTCANKVGIWHDSRDPFESRKAVLDAQLLAQVQEKVTIAPRGPELRNFFRTKLERTVAEAAQSGDKVLVMVSAHGDYDSEGGLCLVFDPGTTNVANASYSSQPTSHRFFRCILEIR